jgi:hypothetical protein
MGTVTTWSRPYRDSYRIATGVLALFVSGFAGVVIVGISLGHSTFSGAGVILAAVMLFFLTVVWRLHRTALVISAVGVRVRWLLKTRTLRWRDIQGYRFGPDLLGVDRLWIDLIDGSHVRTPVQRVHRLMNGSRVSDGGTWLLYDAADTLLRTLDQRLQAERAAP